MVANRETKQEIEYLCMVIDILIEKAVKLGDRPSFRNLRPAEAAANLGSKSGHARQHPVKALEEVLVIEEVVRSRHLEVEVEVIRHHPRDRPRRRPLPGQPPKPERIAAIVVVLVVGTLGKYNMLKDRNQQEARLWPHTRFPIACRREHRRKLQVIGTGPPTWRTNENTNQLEISRH